MTGARVALVLPLVGASLVAPVASADPKREAAVAALLESAREQTTKTRLYDPAYVKLRYPGGDVPIERGVCADVIVRAFRAAGVDLQLLVHQDMSSAFPAYPKNWGLKRPDRNIDHRRVPNLMAFFSRKRKSLPIVERPERFQPGDVVTWRLENGLWHTGLVAAERTEDRARPLVVHNIGEGAKFEDILFAWPVLGHYRWF